MEKEKKEIEWVALLEKAKNAMDEHAEEAYVKRSHAASKKLARSGGKYPFDVNMIQRFLCKFYELGKFTEALKVVGCNKGEFLDSRDWSADIRLVFEYVQKRVKEMAELDLIDCGSVAVNSLKRMATEDGCDLNFKAAEMLAKAAMPDTFGEGSGVGDNRGGKIVYNLPGLTINMITAPNKAIEVKKEQEAIDV